MSLIVLSIQISPTSSTSPKEMKHRQDQGMPPLKRAFDITICVLLMVPVLIVTATILPVVWLDTKASPVFWQKRIGRAGRPFTMLKLRTMRIDTPHCASHEIDASRITRSGRMLRRAKIDELPQLWNVLVGDMSLVGPRPSLPSQVELIEERSRLGVLAIRPGITGIGQLAGLDMSEPVALAQADAAYLGRWTLWGDIILLAQTARGKGSGDAATARR